ncbi:hypothetical protein D3C85_1399330 [compost metagenome]
MPQPAFHVGQPAQQRGHQQPAAEAARAPDRGQPDAAHLRVLMVDQILDQAVGLFLRSDHLGKLPCQRDFFHAAELVLAREAGHLEQQHAVTQHRDPRTCNR